MFKRCNTTNATTHGYRCSKFRWDRSTSRWGRRTWNEIPNISHKDDTEKIVTEENILEEISGRSAEQRNDQEPELPKVSDNSTNFFPLCDNGEILDCQENKSNEVLDESCKGILMFTSETSSCSCRGSNDMILDEFKSNNLGRKSANIVRQGWSKYTR